MRAGTDNPPGLKYITEAMDACFNVRGRGAFRKAVKVRWKPGLEPTEVRMPV